jgi:hypothetical protein
VANQPERGKPAAIFSVHGVRYQVTDVARVAAFYADQIQVEDPDGNPIELFEPAR